MTDTTPPPAPAIEDATGDPRPKPLSAPIRNRVLSALGPVASAGLVVVPLVAGKILVERGAPVRHVFFMETGLVCFLESDAASPQLAMLGTEGAVGLLELVAGAPTAFATAVVQVQGDAIRMDAPDAARLLEPSPAQPLHGPIDPVRLSVQALMRQIMETAAVNARDSLVQRLVRWLLMARSRLLTADIPVTHEALAAMLGVRRAGVTVAVATLQLQGLVRTGRGRITVLDTEGLARLNASDRKMG